MPELKNEVPSDAELRAYLDEHIARSALSILPDFSEHRERYAPEVAAAYDFLLSQPMCPGFFESADRTLYEALRRLNQLPREDPFWENTNRRPTIYKLGEYDARVLSQAPNDRLSLMTCVMTDVAFGRSFRTLCWVPLFRLGAVTLEFVALAAMFTAVTASSDPEFFAQFVVETETVAQARKFVRNVTENGALVLAEWGGVVLQSIDELVSIDPASRTTLK